MLFEFEFECTGYCFSLARKGIYFMSGIYEGSHLENSPMEKPYPNTSFQPLLFPPDLTLREFPSR